VLAQERVIGPARDRIGVEARLPAPPGERTDGAVTAQVRDDQRAVDALRGKKIVFGERLETWEPVVAVAVACGESVGGEITEAMVVGVDSGDGGGDRIERIAPVDEVVGVLAEARELERLSAVGAELGLARVRPSAVAAVNGRAGGCARGGRSRSSCDGRGFVIRRFVTEGPHTLAQLAEDVRKLPCPKNDQHDREDEKKFGTTNTRHRSLPREACSLRLDLPVYACL
jgi:hypothetical protein